jgi:glycosyltransferase involved in cell wall biosynthesis
VAIADRVCVDERIRVLVNGSSNGVDAAVRFDPSRITDNARAGIRADSGVPANAVLIGFVGRVVRDKGVVELAQAWTMLREEYPEIHLFVVGPFESQDPVPIETETLLRLDPRVHLLGEQSNLPPLYRAMDVVALPTYREGLPNVLLEAAAMELPVVATRIPGCVDAVNDGVTGTLVPPADPDALARALRRYLDDPALRRRHGEAARERVLAKFRPEAIWAATYQEYVELLDSLSRRARRP